MKGDWMTEICRSSFRWLNGRVSSFVFSYLLSGIVPQAGSVQGVTFHGVGPWELLTFVQHLQAAQKNPAVNGAHRHPHLSGEKQIHYWEAFQFLENYNFLNLHNKITKIWKYTLDLPGKVEYPLRPRPHPPPPPIGSAHDSFLNGNGKMRCGNCQVLPT